MTQRVILQNQIARAGAALEPRLTRAALRRPCLEPPPMRHLAATLILTALTVLAAPAWAQSPEPEVGVEAPAAPAEAPAAVTRYDYGEDEVTGELGKPVISAVAGELHARLPGLKLVRTSFQEALIASAEEL